MVLEGDAPAPAPASVVTLQDPSPPVSLEKLGVEELNLKSNEFYCYCYKVRRVGALFFFPCVGGRKKKHCTKSQPSALNPNAQVLPCAKRFTHDWSSCLFAHKVRQAGRMRGGGGGGGGETHAPNGVLHVDGGVVLGHDDSSCCVRGDAKHRARRRSGLAHFTWFVTTHAAVAGSVCRRCARRVSVKLKQVQDGRLPLARRLRCRE